MKTMQTGVVLLLCAVSAVFSQDKAFFRLSSPSNAVITGFDPVAGNISWSNDVAGVTNQLQRAYGLDGTSNWMDFVQLVSSSGVAGTERIIDLDPPEGMALIPAGSFNMGDNMDGAASAQPVHSVYVSEFYMDKTEVTKAQWDAVYTWAMANGYQFDRVGSGKGSNHPVHIVSWYDVVKWCNARSQKEGKTAVYTVGGSVYKTGQAAPDCDWSAKGYRLPTEAEWEKAACGGLSGRRFPWGDTIQHTRANYYSSTSYSYDNSSTRGYHPDYDNAPMPYTAPAGSFSANGYGLYNMAGNVWEWCWDWYDEAYYATSPSSNPCGPSSSSTRVLRGGGWLTYAYYCRVANRDGIPPGIVSFYYGFRAVLPAGQ